MIIINYVSCINDIVIFFYLWGKEKHLRWDPAKCVCCAQNYECRTKFSKQISNLFLFVIFRIIGCLNIMYHLNIWLKILRCRSTLFVKIDSTDVETKRLGPTSSTTNFTSRWTTTAASSVFSPVTIRINVMWEWRSRTSSRGQKMMASRASSLKNIFIVVLSVTIDHRHMMNQRRGWWTC